MFSMSLILRTSGIPRQRNGSDKGVWCKRCRFGIDVKYFWLTRRYYPIPRSFFHPTTVPRRRRSSPHFAHKLCYFIHQLSHIRYFPNKMGKWVNELFFKIRIFRFTHKYNSCLVVCLINRIICLYRFYDIFEGYMVKWSEQFNIESFILKIHIVATLRSFSASH